MTDEQRSEVSALADGELDGLYAARLCTLVGQDPELRAVWRRYHTIGQAMRGDRIRPDAMGLADAVRSVLEADPIPIDVRSRRRLPRVDLVPFAGVVLAAGVAFMAVLAVPAMFQGPEAEGWGMPHGLGALASVDASLHRWDTDRRDLSEKLDLFLANHQGTAPAAGVKGVLSYAALVGYAPGR